MILIVDDKAENLFSLKKILERNQFLVDTAGSGEEALKKILKHQYSLIVLDVQMPGMDGFEVAETISGYSRTRDLPILFLSAVNTDKKFITKGYSSGAMDYITKPVDPDILLLKVKTFIRLAEQTRQLNTIQEALRSEIEVRKQAQQELDDKNRELKSILESIPQLAFTARTDGTLEFVNKRWLAYAPGTCRFPQSHPDDTAVETLWERSVRMQSPIDQQVRIRDPEDGSYRYHLLRAIPVREMGQVVKWVGTFTDIHEQKLAAEHLEYAVNERTKELLEANKALELSNNDLQQFASVTSHDLKEPLRKIQVYSTIIRNKYPGDDTEGSLSYYLKRIEHASQRMARLIDDLLSYSRLSASGFFRKTDINEVINEIITDLELTIYEKHAVVQVGEIPVLEAIPSQMRQLLQNIISNSLKFSREHVPPRIQISAWLVADRDIHAPAAEDGRYCRIEVTDNGIGFNEKYLDRIFTIFQQLNQREAFEGTGIGLAIAKRIVEKHKGIITARSNEKSGSTFVILLPVRQDPGTA